MTGIYVLDLRASERTPGSVPWNPHTTHHSDGSLGRKSHGIAFFSSSRQPLTSSFAGTETMGVCPIYLDQVRTISDPWTREPPYTGVFEIPADLEQPTQHLSHLSIRRSRGAGLSRIRRASGRSDYFQLGFRRLGSTDTCLALEEPVTD